MNNLTPSDGIVHAQRIEATRADKDGATAGALDRDVTIPAIGTVLCAVDFSDHSRAALYLAAGVSLAAGSELAILRVDGRSGKEDDVAAARAELDEFVRRTLPGSVAYRSATEAIVAHGRPAEQILAHAARLNAGLIVMGTHGRGALGRMFLGSITERVLRDTSVPLAIVPLSDPEVISLADTRAVPHVGIVLVPIDLAAPSRTQLDWAGRFSLASAHRLLMMYVVPPGADREISRERLETLARGTPTARGIRALVVNGDVVDQVVKIARHDDVGIIVVGRNSHVPGRMAYELVRRAGRVVVFIP